MNASNQWFKLFAACCIVFPLLCASESRAESAAQDSPVAASSRAASDCSGRFGELSSAAAECFIVSVSAEQVEQCVTDEEARCFGGNPVLLGWVRMKRDMRQMHQDPVRVALRAARHDALVQATEQATATIVASAETDR
jgi:hypothetical protein